MIRTYPDFDTVRMESRGLRDMASTQVGQGEPNYEDAPRESAQENSLQVLRLRDHTDPGPNGSRAGSYHSVQGPLAEQEHVNANTNLQVPPHGNPTRTHMRGVFTTEQPRREAELGEAPVNTGVVDPLITLVQGFLERLDQRIPENRNNHQESPPDYLKVVMLMKNLGTARFKGGYDPLEADAWIENLERNFDATRCPEEYKLDVAVYYLEKDALNWWRNIAAYFGNQLPTWNHFKIEFKRKYFPSEARDRLEIQFMEISQGSRSVREYEVEFTRLRRYAHYGPEQEDMIVRKFMRGLRPNIRSRLQVVEFRDLYELIERAVNVEEGIIEEQASDTRLTPYSRPELSRPESSRPRFQANKSFGRGKFLKGNNNQRRGSSSGSRFGSSGRLGNTTKNTMTCYQCGQTGHTRNYCPMLTQQRPVPSYVRCFQCGEQGHYSSNCSRNQPVPLRTVPPTKEQQVLEHVPKRPAIAGRVYTLGVDNPEPSRPYKGPITGTYGL